MSEYFRHNVQLRGNERAVYLIQSTYRRFYPPRFNPFRSASRDIAGGAFYRQLLRCTFEFPCVTCPFQTTKPEFENFRKYELSFLFKKAKIVTFLVLICLLKVLPDL